MSFESGSVSFRMFYVPKGLPEDVVAKFARHAAPPLETLSDGEINGWVSGRHLLDRKITKDNAYYGNFLRLTLMQAERKIPEPLLRAECKMEELAQLQASGEEKLSQATRSDIRRSVTARLLPSMPPQLKGIPFIYDENAKLIYATALSEKQMDAFLIIFTQTIGFGPIPVAPETASIKRMEVNLRDWTPASYSPEVEDDAVSNDAGMDFLTWLWFVSEARGGMVSLDKLGQFAVMLEGPLTFLMEGGGAHETVLRKGEPMLSAEAKTCLLAGKKLRRAKLTLARGDESWKCGFDAETFVVRGLKLPETEKLDAVSRFQDRMAKIDAFQEALLSLYDRFVAERADKKKWSACRDEIHAWVKGRKIRR